MKRIALYHLETLLTIARMGTFRAAAERLNTTQPAISARIREMETQLGISIFRREGRNMVLTARGRQLVQDCEPLWAQFETVLMQPGEFAGAVGVVRIGTGEIAAASCLTDFVIETERSLPGITLEVDLDLTSRMLQNLLGGTRDMVFLAGPVAAPGIRTAPVGAVDLVWLANPNTAANLPALDRVRVWSIPAHSPIYQISQESLLEQDIAFRSINTCNNVRTLTDIIQHGHGIALFPLSMMHRSMENGDLVEVLTRPARQIEFQVAVRVAEADPVINQMFERARHLSINPASRT